MSWHIRAESHAKKFTQGHRYSPSVARPLIVFVPTSLVAVYAASVAWHVAPSLLDMPAEHELAAPYSCLATSHSSGTSPMAFKAPHPYITLIQWYPFKAAPSAELLAAYAADVNVQIERSIKAYHSEVQTEQIEVDDDPPMVQVMRHHRGLDDESWDLNDVFGDYFPNLQRASAVITLFAFFERELEDLCNLIQTTEGYRLTVREVYGSGIERAVTYLEKVCGIDTDKGSKEWAEVRAIQLVRGLIAHGGRADLEQNKQVKEAIEASQHLSYTDELKVAQEYPGYIIGTFSRYFGVLHRSIKTIYQAKLAALPKT